MADIAQIEAALVKADAAGDVEGARILAGEVRRLRSTAKPQAAQADVRKAENAMTPIVPPSTTRKAFDFVKDAAAASPAGVMASGIASGTQSLNEMIEKFAYRKGGEVTDAYGPEAGFAVNVGIQAIPAVLGGEVAKLASPAVRAGAERVMQSALKPDAKARMPGYGGAPSKAQIANRVMLDEGLNVSEGGVAQLRQRVVDGKADINRVVADANARGATVDKAAIAANQPAVEARFSQAMDPARRDANLDTIQTRYMDWLTDPSIPNRIPVSQAQALKEGEQAFLRTGGNYGSPTNSANIAVSKDMARSMRLQLEQAIPEIADLNRREADLITTLAIADKRASLAGNANIGGLSFLAHNPKAAAAFMLDRSSQFKSILARMMNANQRTAPGALGAAAGGVAGHISGRAPSE